MAYMNQEKKAKIAAALKPVLKKYGIKGSLRVRSHSTIVLTIKSGRVDFIEDYLAVRHPGDYVDPDYIRSKGNVDVNPYHYQNHFEGLSVDFLNEAFAALKSADWYDESDAMVDYFNTAYYYDIEIGKWDKPYILEK
jgi:hypothetical protein